MTCAGLKVDAWTSLIIPGAGDTFVTRRMDPHGTWRHTERRVMGFAVQSAASKSMNR